MLYAEILRELDGHFRRIGVRYMPIKGAYLILDGLAELIESRKMADIDILVEKDHFGAAADYFASLDMTTEKPDAWYFERVFMYRYGRFEVQVELHYLLNRPERFLLPTEELFARGARDGAWRWLPSREDALCIELCHVLVHVAYVVREHIFDDIRALTADHFDWDRFWTIARSTGVARFMRALLYAYNLREGGAAPVGAVGVMDKTFARLLHPSMSNRMPRWAKRGLLELSLVREPLQLALATVSRRTVLG
jgi:hypothetical protein